MKSKQIYLPDKQALAYYREKASPEFWDRHWSEADLQGLLQGSTNDGFFAPIVERHLPLGSTILEGGCGIGQIVSALHNLAYKAIGVDIAPETVRMVKEVVPELDIRLGEVRNLELPDSSLDGYISAGVIEHFWEGHMEIAREMHRTLKVGGILFISFPYMSPLRRLKAALNSYPSIDSNLLNDQVDQFY